MLVLNNIGFGSGGTRIEYDYTCSADCSRFFTGRPPIFSEYSEDVSVVPYGIAVIPFLANMAPIAWFAGFDIQVKEVDSVFLEALEAIRTEMAKYHPQLSKDSKIVTQAVKHDFTRNGSAMLFSGGVDAFATYFRHVSENPALFTIQGADIALSDKKQWDEVLHFNENEPILTSNPKHYVRTNLLDFYNYEVNSLLPNGGWWGKIQHGLALICATAPIAFIKGYSKIYIASTRSAHMEFDPWGSMPETDNLIAWTGTQAIHDAYELKRQEKVYVIADALRTLGRTTQIRVCYDDYKTSLNCSKCEKCVRTMFGLMISGANPNDFGFQANEQIYHRIEKLLERGFVTKGSQFFWREMLEELEKGRSVFIFKDADVERAQLEKIKKLIALKANEALKVAGQFKRFRQDLARKYPKLLKFYLKLRRIT